MKLLSSLQNSVNLIRDFPMILIYVLGLSAVFGTMLLVPLLGSLIALAVSPAILGGMYELVNRAYEGEKPTIEILLKGAKKHYKSLLGAYAVIAFITIVLIGVFGFLLWAADMASGGSKVSPMMIGFSSVGLIMFLSLIHIAQFFDAIIIVEEISSVESIKQSLKVVIDNPVQTLGYTGIRVGTIVFLSTASIGLVYGLMSLESHELSLSTVITLLLPVIIVGQAVLGSVFYSYHICFYRRLKESQQEPDQSLTEGS